MPGKSEKLKRIFILASMLQQKRKLTVRQYLSEIRINHPELKCSERTARRDIATLRETYDAPLEYSYAEESYILTAPWELPVLLDDEVENSLIGIQLARAFVPDPLKKDMDETINSIISTMGAGELSAGTLSSLIVASKPKVTINPDVFREVFLAWKEHHAVNISYKKLNGDESRRMVEPYLIVYSNYIWYLKGYCHLSGKVKVFAVHRITDAETARNKNDRPLSFEPDRKILDDAEENGIFDYPRIREVRLLCRYEKNAYILEQAQAKGFEAKLLGNGKIEVKMEGVVEHEFMRWVLGAAGDIEIVHPLSLRNKIIDYARKLLETHS